MAKRKRKYKKKVKKIESSLSKRGRRPQLILELAEKFFYPLLGVVPEGMAVDRMGYIMDLFFNTKNRHLYFCRTLEPFNMPGETYITGTKTRAGYGKRGIEENELLLIVEDDTLEYVKVEVCRGKSETNYKLSIAEFNYIKQKLRRV